MQAWTDTYIEGLGDSLDADPPIRAVKVLYCHNRAFVEVEVEGLQLKVARGYVYQKPGRYGEVRCISPWKLHYADGRPFWKRNTRRLSKTTWTVKQWRDDGTTDFREYQTLREAEKAFRVAQVGARLAKNRHTHQVSSFCDVSERIPTEYIYTQRVRKRRRGRK